jgi:DNA repair exonuclease SbcCD ATPase subunit|nr:MAG TPA: zinc-ribbon containing domain protein [Caudoviricetes sp.]
MTENEVLEYLKSSKRKNDMLGILPGSDIGNTIIKALEELKQYRTIGTPEECRAAVKKQKPMAVVEKTMISHLGKNVGICPVCEGVPLRQHDHPYCPDCGQKLDWEDEE